MHAQLCPTLCDPINCSPPGSSVHGILQARVLEWVAISFSRGSSQPRDRIRVSCIAGRCFILWATREVRGQAPLSMGFSRQEYWSGSPFPFPGDLPPDPHLWCLPELADGLFTTNVTWEALQRGHTMFNIVLPLSHFSRVRLCATPYTAAHQAPPSLGFSRQEHWSGLPFPFPQIFFKENLSIN